jgi:hypothetical protein
MYPSSECCKVPAIDHTAAPPILGTLGELGDHCRVDRVGLGQPAVEVSYR